MRFFLICKAILIFTVCLCFSPLVICKSKNSSDNSEGNYYEIYKAIDSLRELTKFNTFYELLKVDASSTSEQVSKAFRRLSLQNHPDKLKGQGLWNDKQEKLSNLIQFIGSLLRSDVGRKTYNWILNEAPALHREHIYVTRKSNGKRTQISSTAVILFFLGLSVFLNAISLYGRWFLSITESKKAKEALKAYSLKEIKSANRRQKGTLALLLTKSEMDTSIPSPLNLWIFKPFKVIFSRFSTKTPLISSVKEE